MIDLVNDFINYLQTRNLSITTQKAYVRYVNKFLRNLAPYKVASHKIWDVPVEERDKILKLDWNEATIPPSPLVQKHCVHPLLVVGF